MATSNDTTLVVSSKPCQSAQTSKTSEHAHIYIYIVINGSKISIHRFIATTLFRMDKLRKNDPTHQAIETNDC